MSRVFLPSGEVAAVTYLRIEPNVVIRTKTKEKDGYNAVVLGIGAKQWKTRKGKELTRFSVQKEWQVESTDGLEKGKTLTADALPDGSMVTIVGVSKGKGFQGVVRRHHFAGGPGSHGSHMKREPGSVGMRGDPGKILKGHKMSGQMGHDQRTIKHRPVLVCDAQNGIVGVKGPVPGPNGAAVYVTLEPSPSKK
jgi:large subunit ribosomal protein L3